MQLGRVYDAACRIALAEVSEVADDVVIPVVGECDDSWLSCAGAMQVEFDDVVAARDAARASAGSGVRPATGAVGAGTGMLCLGWKGGIGTASRVLPSGHTVGVLLLTNFGQWDRLTVGGVPVGRLLGRLPPGALPCPVEHSTACGHRLRPQVAAEVQDGDPRAGDPATHRGRRLVPHDRRVADPDSGDVEHGVGRARGQGPDGDPEIGEAGHGRPACHHSSAWRPGA
jgi:hypothetical protein